MSRKHTPVPQSLRPTPGGCPWRRSRRCACPTNAMDPQAAYRFIHDELMLDGSSRLNLATFVTTWMDPEAEKLMAETFDKNMIDKDEYPATAAIEQRCVCMVADLFHAEDLRDDDPASAIGVSTVGSSEAVMLAGLALSWRWRARSARKGRLAQAQAQPGDGLQRPGGLGEVLPLLRRRAASTCRWRRAATSSRPSRCSAHVDEDTIGVVAILGTTFTGELEPIAEICAALDKLAADGGVDVPVHVDAASGGFVVPFLHPDLVWDFRLPRVVSINVSGHKYGLTYPGIGFVVWRSAEHLPEDLVFRVNYLGGDMPTFTLNFSRPGNQVVGQYYNFLRLGRAGLHAGDDVPVADRAVARRPAARQRALRADLRRLGDPGGQLPARPAIRGYTEFDVSHALRAYGWQVPAYTMPDDATDVAVLRVVVREGFSADLARALQRRHHHRADAASTS